MSLFIVRKGEKGRHISDFFQKKASLPARVRTHCLGRAFAPHGFLAGRFQNGWICQRCCRDCVGLFSKKGRSTEEDVLTGTLDALQKSSNAAENSFLLQMMKNLLLRECQFGKRRLRKKKTPPPLGRPLPETDTNIDSINKILRDRDKISPDKIGRFVFYDCGWKEYVFFLFFCLIFT